MKSRYIKRRDNVFLARVPEDQESHAENPTNNTSSNEVKIKRYFWVGTRVVKRVCWYTIRALRYIERFVRPFDRWLYHCVLEDTDHTLRSWNEHALFGVGQVPAGQTFVCYRCQAWVSPKIEYLPHYYVL